MPTWRIAWLKTVPSIYIIPAFLDLQFTNKRHEKRPAGMSFLYTNITLGYYKQNCHIQIVLLWSKAYIVSFFTLSINSLFFFLPKHCMLCSSKKKTCILIILRAHKCSPCQLFHIILVLALSWQQLLLMNVTILIYQYLRIYLHSTYTWSHSVENYDLILLSSALKAMTYKVV